MFSTNAANTPIPPPPVRQQANNSNSPQQNIAIPPTTMHTSTTNTTAATVPVVIANSNDMPSANQSQNIKKTVSLQKHNASANTINQQALAAATANINNSRFQETRSNGAITQVKVNNARAPDYYLYPNSTGNKTSGSNNVAGSNVSTPSWQVSW